MMTKGVFPELGILLVCSILLCILPNNMTIATRGCGYTLALQNNHQIYYDKLHIVRSSVTWFAAIHIP